MNHAARDLVEVTASLSPTTQASDPMHDEPQASDGSPLWTPTLTTLLALGVAFGMSSQAPAQALASTTVTTTGSPIGAALGDFDRDGRCDAAFVHQSNTTPSQLALFLGDGIGGLQAHASFACSGTGGVGIVAGDWNGDSLLDAVTVELVNNTSTFGRVSYFAGDGTGGFQAAVPFIVGAGSRSVAAADFNLDGFLDIVTSNSSATANTITILLGNGAGSFTALPDVPAGSKPWSIAAGDLNGDGVPDVATANNGSSTLSILLNNGTASFPGGPIEKPTGGGTRGIAIGDVNGDGAADVATANGTGNDVTVWFGNGAGAYPVSASVPVGTNPSSVTIGDVNGDAWADLCVTNQTGLVSNAVSITLGNGSASLPAPTFYPVGQFPSLARVADLDADGRQDIVACNYGGSSATILHNVSVPPPACANYGIGTTGCRGALGLAAASAPSLGNAAFRVNATNAPVQALGLLLFVDTPDALGSDPFGLGAKLHVDLFASATVMAFDTHSDGCGESSLLAPIPEDASLVNASFYGQALFIEPAGNRCTSSPFGLVTSAGIAISITL